MYTIQDLFDNPSDYIRCETQEDLELFRNACERAGYGEGTFNIIIEHARDRIKKGHAYLIRSNPTGITNKFNGMDGGFRDKFQRVYGHQDLYKNPVRAEELCAIDSSEQSFNLDLFNQMLGV